MINDYIISIKKPKRTYQNSLFVDYLSQKDKLIRIFNAVTGENCPLDVEGFEINTLHPILFDDFVNDVSFKIGNRYMFLLEHQSTVCPNIPLRMILYHNQFILKLIVVRDKKDKRKLKVDDRLYSTTRIIIPMPIFVEFYTGETKANLPEESDYTVELLSESFSPKAPLDCRLFNFKGFPVQ
ncbi:MAG: hypothetical protein LBS60_13435, partial [Deltaproteobacteria bacterium]|nr:hypothetical protein [Deltaproteobacteria bacterium]